MEIKLLKIVNLLLEELARFSNLTLKERWIISAASVMVSRNIELQKLILMQAEQLQQQIIEEVKVLAAVMTTNNVYHKFRHMVGKVQYSRRSPKMRMGQLANRLLSRREYELAAVAVSTINGCSDCIKSHEKKALEAGCSEQTVVEAIEIAALISALSVHLSISAMES